MTHRRLLPLAALAALALVLASCQVTITDGRTPTWPPVFNATLEAQATFDPSAQESGTLASGATRYFDLEVDVQRDLLYAEVQGSSGLRVSLYTSGGTRLAVSESATYFGASVSALASSADAVAGSSISVAFQCLGPCAAVTSASDSYVVAVTNTSNSSRDFEVFAYTFNETDTNEPNDAVASPTLLSGAGNYAGAIEVLGDVDHFEYDATAGGSFFVVFQPFDLALGLELEILDCAECKVLDGTSGFLVEGLVDGDLLRVRSATGRAGPNATSGYSLQVTASPPAGAAVSSR
ncbi:MAG: hypothetical protein ABR510_00835 [Trueperaceae bacterium]